MRRALFLLLLLLALSAGLTAPLHAEGEAHTFVVAPRGPFTTLKAALDVAQPGDTIEVEGGVHPGPWVLDKAITLVGLHGAVLDGQGEGTVLTLTAPGTVVRGFTIRGSGESLDRENGGVVIAAPDSVLEDNRIEDVLFGVTVAQSPRSIVRGNTIIGKPLEVARRGDGLRVWESPDTLVENNHLSQGRDLLLWYSDGTTLRGNTVTQGRYGLHFMFNHQTTVEGNLLYENSVGVYLMYSDHIVITRNTLLNNRGPSGYGLGLKDVNWLVASENLFLDNRVAVYLDNSPMHAGAENRFEGNRFAYNDIGLLFLPQVKHNAFTGNSFVENGQQLLVEGSGQFEGNLWRGNHWSDYVGYDADGDGLGDLPYRNESLFESLLDRSPELRLFRLSPAAQAVDFAARAFPVVAPQPRLTDETPLMAPTMPTGVPLPAAASPRPLLLVSLGLLGLAAALLIKPWLTERRYRTRHLRRWHKHVYGGVQ